MKPVYAFFIFSVIFFLCVVIYFNIAVLGEKFNPAEDAITLADYQAKSLRDPQADTDADGLKNWEEDLYGTSKKSADSDGDGIGDGQEVARGTDPTLYGDITGYGEVEQIITEQVYSEEFVPSPQGLDLNTLQSLISGGDPLALASMLGIDLPEGIEGAEGAVTSPQMLIQKRGINAIGTIVQNASLTSTEDVEVINGYFSGENQNTVAIDIAIAADLKAAQLMRGTTSEDDSIQGFIDRFAYHYQEMARTMQVLKTKGYSGREVEHAEWQTYTTLVSTWLGTIQDFHTFVLGNELNFSQDEPGSIFLFEIEGA